MSKIKSKKTEERELDNIWKKKVKDRDNWTCQICYRNMRNTPKSCNAHHILPKLMKRMRWDVKNGITLCPNHHSLGIFSAHQNAIWFFGWMNTNKKEQLNHCIDCLSKHGKTIK